MQVLARFIPVIFVGRSGSFKQSDSVFVRMKHQRAHFSCRYKRRPSFTITLNDPRVRVTIAVGIAC